MKVLGSAECSPASNYEEGTTTTCISVLLGGNCKRRG